MTAVNTSRTHPNDKLHYIPKSGMSCDHTRKQGLAAAGVWGCGGGETL